MGHPSTKDEKQQLPNQTLEPIAYAPAQLRVYAINLMHYGHTYAHTFILQYSHKSDMVSL